MLWVQPGEHLRLETGLARAVTAKEPRAGIHSFSHSPRLSQLASRHHHGHEAVREDASLLLPAPGGPGPALVGVDHSAVSGSIFPRDITSSHLPLLSLVQMSIFS